MTAKTSLISATDVLPLRREVLRPGRPPETAIFAGDDHPTTTHWGAFAQDGRLVAIATLLPAPKPGSPTPAWQLRGMASHPSVRGQGYGAAVLLAILDALRAREPGALLWCNARVSALGFYRRHAFVTEGTPFEIAGVGPHYVMSRCVIAPGDAVPPATA